MPRLRVRWLCSPVMLLVSVAAISEGQADAPQEPPAAAGTAPDWFRPDPAKPYAIFDAWRRLSTREAALYLHSYTLDRAWTVLGGVLKDEDGRPLPLTPIGIHYNDGLRSYGARLRTDAKGRFLVYSPYSLKVISNATGAEPAAMTREERLARMNERACGFTAYPGYPYSGLGFRYAASNRGSRRCRAKLVMRADDRAFYELTCDGRSAFDADGFARFRTNLMGEHARQVRRPYRARPRPHEGLTKDHKRTTYRLRVVSPEGKGVPDAIVKFLASGGGAKGNYQIVETGAEGECSVDEYVDVDEARSLREKISRQLTVDAPGYGVGPVRCTLDADALNVVTMHKPAAVSGTLVDHNGNATSASLMVVYRNRCHCPFELDVRTAPDGSFSFERIMPGEPFKIVARRGSSQTTPSAPVETGYMTLEPGELREGIRIAVPLASAVRGIVVDGGAPVGKLHHLDLMFEDGSGLGHGGPLGSRFAFSGLGAMPFRIRAQWSAYTEWITLVPGELRFVRLDLQELSKGSVSASIKELGDKAAFVREHAASALGKAGPDASGAVSDLAAALQDADWHVRKAAAYALSQIGPAARGAVPALVRALEDEHRLVRSNAANVLGDIGPGAAEAAPALVRLLERGGDGDRVIAAWALGKIGPGGTGAVPALAKALRDEDWDVRETAASALGEFGEAAGEAAPALVGLLSDTAPLLTERLWDDYRRAYAAAERALVKIGKPAVPVLEKALRDKLPDVRATAAWALDRIRAGQRKDPKR